MEEKVRITFSSKRLLGQSVTRGQFYRRKTFAKGKCEMWQIQVRVHASSFKPRLDKSKKSKILTL